MTGLLSVMSFLTINGTAIPTKETGPANAVTMPDKRLDKSMIDICRALTFTPTLLAYTSPFLYAPIGFDTAHTIIDTIRIKTAANAASCSEVPEKLPCDHPCIFTTEESPATLTIKSVTAVHI